MGLQDIIITPIYLLLFLRVAYILHPFVTNRETKKFFVPALALRFFGAIMLGVVYQYYYDGGDTYIYFEHGSKWIWQALLDNPIDGFRLLTKSGPQHVPDLYKYSQHIWYYRDSHSYLVVVIVAIIDLFTFHTYSATALFFAVFSFSGLWAMFTEVQKKYPKSTRWLAYGILFFPSLVFWGSGILKDSITLGALGWLTWALIRWIETKRKLPLELLVILLSTWLIYSIKEYIVICYVPLVFVWLFFKNVKKLRSVVLRILVVPLLIGLFAISGYLALLQLSKESERYSLDNVAERARITAYDIRYGWGARTGGDGGYDIGLPDGTFAGMIRQMPAAINVSLFRPYLWEVKNPLMLLSALESLMVLILTIRVIFKGSFKLIYKDSFLIFCLGFLLMFAFAVGVSTFNFGTLMRYKIPIWPFFAILVSVSQPASRKIEKENF